MGYSYRRKRKKKQHIPIAQAKHSAKMLALYTGVK